ncbi:response regulator transcription factor [Jonesia quinghaiensis]|uniref:response regulator transcription factor n=1 Tax=Jonesia quinghaiensis TaxID=262806 RepID=UPI000411F912|nr:response regulator transcription factor [Jonesia quinghaiensis]
MTTTVLVADDQSLIRQAVTAILSSHPDIDVVGEAADGVQAVAAVSQQHPDVVLMDIRMPHQDGIEATAEICGNPDNDTTRVLILTTFEEDDNLVAALRAGASGFIGKGAEPEDIVNAVIAVHAGDTLLSPRATHALVERYVRPRPPVATGQRGNIPDQLKHLTEREREVLILVAQGLSNQDIADALVISPHTAKTHVNRTMAKLHAHDRAQLVIVAYETGLLTPGQGTSRQDQSQRPTSM